VSEICLNDLHKIVREQKEEIKELKKDIKYIRIEIEKIYKNMDDIGKWLQ